MYSGKPHLVREAAEFLNSSVTGTVPSADGWATAGGDETEISSRKGVTTASQRVKRFDKRDRPAQHFCGGIEVKVM